MRINTFGHDVRPGLTVYAQVHARNANWDGKKGLRWIWIMKKILNIHLGYQDIFGYG